MRFEWDKGLVTCGLEGPVAQVPIMWKRYGSKSMPTVVFAAYTFLTGCTQRRSCPMSSKFGCPLDLKACARKNV